MKASLFTLIEFTSFSLVSFVFVLKCPFNKVEESFNTHIVSDVINKFPFHMPQDDLHNDFNEGSVLTLNQTWDHMVFPGVVPRTFVGSLLIGLVMKLPKAFLQLDDYQLRLQIGSRLLLATFVSISLTFLSCVIQRRLGALHRICFFLISVSQFHYLFYASRFLPNTYATILSNLVFAHWLNRRYTSALTYIALSVVIFRIDTCILFGWLIIDVLVKRQLNLSRLLKVGVPAGLLAIAITFSVDSIFWVRPVWPELESLYFNLWLNKSHEWGTQPYFWYFLNCLPRLLMSSLPFLLLAEKAIFMNFLLPSLAFICTYSFLPHKELRFILFVVPIFNLCASSGIVNIYKFLKRIFKKSWATPKLLICLIITAVISINFLGIFIMLSVAEANYPGGEAGEFVMRDIRISGTFNKSNIGVHINNLASQTGFSRFLQLNDVSYSKSPKLPSSFPLNYSLSYIILEPNELKNFCVEIRNTDCLLFKNPSSTDSAEESFCSIVKSIKSFDGFDKTNLKSSLASLTLEGFVKKLIKTSISLHVIRCTTK